MRLAAAPGQHQPFLPRLTPSGLHILMMAPPRLPTVSLFSLDFVLCWGGEEL